MARCFSVCIPRVAQKRESKYLNLAHIKDDGELRYAHDLGSDQQALPAIQVIRRVLTNAADRSIAIVQVGLASNLADLIESPADSISPLNGRELVRQKVRLTSVMAGAFRPVRGNDHFLEANVGFNQRTVCRSSG
ncbi:MAG: hypothetical protein AAGD07_23295 [Planctomycetota bacterium]